MSEFDYLDDSDDFQYTPKEVLNAMTPPKRLRTHLQECHDDPNPNHDLPSFNYLSEIPLELRTTLTRDKVQQTVDEARLFDVPYLVHLRQCEDGTEHIVQMLAKSDLHIDNYISTMWPYDEKPIVVQIIDLHNTKRDKVDKWIKTFFTKAPEVAIDEDGLRGSVNSGKRFPPLPLSNAYPVSCTAET